MRFLRNLIIRLLTACALVAGSYVFAEVSQDNFLSADTIKYDNQTNRINASGHVNILNNGYVIRANSVTYDISSGELWANGGVRVKSIIKSSNKKKFQMDGDSVYFKDKMKKGIIRNFVLYFGDNSIIASRLAERSDENHSRLEKSKYTACSICNNRHPIWEISAKKTNIDLEKEKVTYENAFFQIYGVPVFYTPYFAHPTPKAKPQSGILIPNKKKAGIGLPIYYRAKDNLDFTLTPRFNKSTIVTELETRYLTERGKYNLMGSYAKSKVTKTLKDGTKKTGKYHRYFVSGQGVVSENGYSYQIDANRVSDKAYLKEFYNRNDNMLKSSLYVEKVDRTNFVTGEAISFQGLKAEDSRSTDPFVLPEIRVKHVAPIVNEDTTLTLENNAISFGRGANYNAARNSFSALLYHKYTTDNGQIINVSGYDRIDMYHIDSSKTTNQPDQNKTLMRNIPEVHVGWRYPLARMNSLGGHTLIEPRALLVVGQGDFRKNNKYNYIDSVNYNMREDNLFSSNRNSGIDFHEYGRRVSYGISATHNTKENCTLKAFLGSLNYLNKPAPRDTRFLIKTSINFDGMVEIYQNSTISNRDFNPIRREFGTWYDNGKFYAGATLIDINLQKAYYGTTNRDDVTEDIKQLSLDTKYKINERWRVGFDTTLDVRSDKKFSLISRNIRVTYNWDCVSMSLRFGRSYTSDPKRGIYKTNTREVALSLKTIDF
ncbi:MAG: LPS-assembly protein LptD [Rickettsiaceae bacterium]|nr:LPS-assembly protein LptD [Rickettsiaceae bacterium]